MFDLEDAIAITEKDSARLLVHNMLKQFADLYKELGIETANMVDKILNGEKPSAMPVKVFKDDLNIYINQSALDSLGLTLPEDIQNNERLVIVE